MTPHCLVPPNFKVLLGGETKQKSGNFGDLSGWVLKASNPLSESLLLYVRNGKSHVAAIYALGGLNIKRLKGNLNIHDL